MISVRRLLVRPDLDQPGTTCPGTSDRTRPARTISKDARRIRVALAKPPLSPTGGKGPATLAEGGIPKIPANLGAVV